MDSKILKEYINNDQLLIDELAVSNLSESVIDYPYSQPLRLLYLVALKRVNSPIFISELKKAALFIADRKLLYHLLEEVSTPKVSELADTSTIVSVDTTNDETLAIEESEPDKTTDLIDAFLATLPEDEVYNNGLELSSDYTGYLLEEGETSSNHMLEGQDLIDEFIRSQSDRIDKKLQHRVEEFHPVESVEDESLKDDIPVKQESESEDEGFFTETLSRIYVKQQRYDKALEILKKLSLKYPNKNAYFADQIRFLEKLIINDKSK